MYHMIIEQTRKYQKRMVFNPETNSFTESEYDSLAYVRRFKKPYGWIKESGTPPQSHWDVILMSDDEFELGDEVEIKIIGVFVRSDGDHKYVAVKIDRFMNDLFELLQTDIDDLKRLYPGINNEEGWFGRAIAEKCMNECEKAL